MMRGAFSPSRKAPGLWIRPGLQNLNYKNVGYTCLQCARYTRGAGAGTGTDLPLLPARDFFALPVQPLNGRVVKESR